jgi:hypothetical protein
MAALGQQQPVASLSSVLLLSANSGQYSAELGASSMLYICFRLNELTEVFDVVI